MSEPIRVDPTLIARCGLYCGACRAYRKGRCPGCRENVKAGWCKVRTCCGEHGYASCADCTEFPDPKACPTFDNAIARLFGLIFNADRRACVLELKTRGPEGFTAFMSDLGRQSLPRRRH